MSSLFISFSLFPLSYFLSIIYFPQFMSFFCFFHRSLTSVSISSFHLKCGPGSSAGIATGYGLGGAGIESRWGARFSAPVQTGPGAHPASCTVGTGSFPVVKSGRGVTLNPRPLLVPWSRKSRAIY